jgi:hypothetical protein
MQDYRLDESSDPSAIPLQSNGSPVATVARRSATQAVSCLGSRSMVSVWCLYLGSKAGYLSQSELPKARSQALSAAEMSIPRELLHARLTSKTSAYGTRHGNSRCLGHQQLEAQMARGGLLWLLGVPIPILLLMWAVGWLH